MLFARRKKAGFGERLRVAAWPRRSWPRSFRYVGKRTWRIAASPHEIALGFSFGALMSCTPLMGLHILLAMLLARLCKVSMIASALGTIVGNPLTFPFIWASSLGLGNWLLGRSETLEHVRPPDGRDLRLLDDKAGIADMWATVLSIWEPLIKPMLVGGIPLGLAAAIVCYFPVRRAVALFQAQRKQAMRRKTNANLAAHSS